MKSCTLMTLTLPGFTCRFQARIKEDGSHQMNTNISNKTFQIVEMLVIYLLTFNFLFNVHCFQLF